MVFNLGRGIFSFSVDHDVWPWPWTAQRVY